MSLTTTDLLNMYASMDNMYASPLRHLHLSQTTMRVTATNLRAELFRTLDRVIATGEPVEVERPGGWVRLVAAAPAGRLSRLRAHPGCIVGDAAELASLSWPDVWQPTL